MALPWTQAALPSFQTFPILKRPSSHLNCTLNVNDRSNGGHAFSASPFKTFCHPKRHQSNSLTVCRQLSRKAFPLSPVCSYYNDSTKVLTGDLVIYKLSKGQPWKLAAVTNRHLDTIDIAPVCSRSVDDHGKVSIFIDWSLAEAEAISFSMKHAQIISLDVDFESRVIEDRIINPHGEESEGCWCVDPALLETWSISLKESGH